MAIGLKSVRLEPIHLKFFFTGAFVASCLPWQGDEPLARAMDQWMVASTAAAGGPSWEWRGFVNGLRASY